jgi:hypothetical protein
MLTYAEDYERTPPLVLKATGENPSYTDDRRVVENRGKET